MNEMSVNDPYTGGLLCPCGRYYPRRRTAPIPLFDSQKTERIDDMADELGVLMATRPTYVPVNARYQNSAGRTYRPRKVSWLVQVLIIMAATAALVAGAAMIGRYAAVSGDPTPKPSAVETDYWAVP